MSAHKNLKYKVVSNIKDYLEQDFARKKIIFEHENKRKYFRVDYFREVGEYCGINASTVSQMHVRNLLPSYVVSVKMAEYLGVVASDIWEVVEDEEKTGKR